MSQGARNALQRAVTQVMAYTSRGESVRQLCQGVIKLSGVEIVAGLREELVGLIHQSV